MCRDENFTLVILNVDNLKNFFVIFEEIELEILTILFLTLNF